MQFLYWKDKCILAKIFIMLSDSSFDMSILSECPYPHREQGVETQN